MFGASADQLECSHEARRSGDPEGGPWRSRPRLAQSSPDHSSTVSTLIDEDAEAAEAAWATESEIPTLHVRSPAKLYEFHVANLRIVGSAIEHLARAGRDVNQRVADLESVAVNTIPCAEVRRRLPQRDWGNRRPLISAHNTTATTLNAVSGSACPVASSRSCRPRPRSSRCTNAGHREVAFSEMSLVSTDDVGGQHVAVGSRSR
jgi:hypothetical protein